MSEDLYGQKLAWFKQDEKPETNLEVRRAEKLTELKGESEGEVWGWLWQNTKYSRTELMERIGVSFSDSGFENMMKPLIGNGVIYPDGSVNSYVQRYLRERVLKLFDTKGKRVAGKG